MKVFADQGLDVALSTNRCTHGELTEEHDCVPARVTLWVG